MLSPEASDRPQRRQRSRISRLGVAVAAALAVTACAGGSDVERGQSGALPGSAGLFPADEPHAAPAARDILSAGGTAISPMTRREL